MKKIIAIFLCCALTLALTGCAGTTVVVGNCTCPPESHQQAETPAVTPAEGALKTGLAIVTNSGNSIAATAEANGKAEYDVTVVAVTVDEKGVIASCVIDSLGASAEFDASGLPVSEGTAELMTKNELGFDYGMVKASPIGKEWFEQAAALAKFAEGKTMEEVKRGYSSDVDLATSATVYLGGYVDAMEKAVANAKNLGAEAGDELKLAVIATLQASAGQESGGAAILNLDAVALTMADGIITSGQIDSLQAEVAFDGTGVITSDLSAPKTKNELGFDYGMAKISPIGKEWFEQAEYFCRYIVGKTPAEVAGIAVTETTATTDVDLATGCTIGIGGFQTLIAKAAG